ncbi:MAG: PhzF family phenazine biosynthesis protein [Myxococcota bacterium]
MSLPVYQIDAFTTGPFSGNPAGVCLLEAWPTDAWMQSVAMEMALSETAFVVREPEGLRLRWFTPTAEVDLCGHATLATAHALWHEEGSEDDVLRFQTRSGWLEARAVGERIRIDLPALVPEAADAPSSLAAALGVGADAGFFRSRFDSLVVLEDEAALRALTPDMRALMDVDTRGVIVTAPSASYDCVSRFFAPRVGVPEDPVTGSAHCVLAPYWTVRLGKETLRAYQASKRGGELELEVRDERVLLTGGCRTFLRGTIDAENA